MNLQKTLRAVLAVVVATGLSACGGGNDNNPANQPVQYGRLGSVTQLDFGDAANQQPATLQADLNALINIANNIPLLAEPQPAGLGFTVGNIAGNAAGLGIDHVNAYAITYNTPGVNPQSNLADVSRTVSGLVLVPVQANGTLINNPKGMVVFYHPTEPAKNSVPSCLTSALVTNTPAYCNNPQAGTGADGDLYFQLLSSVYAAAGYIVVAPDYIGEGIDNNVVHPYVLFPEVDADSGLYMMGAARTLLAQENLLPASTPLNLFITGFSEGGAYALNASQQAQTQLSSYLGSQNVNLKITAPAEGAYDVPAQMQFSFKDLEDGVLYCGLNGTTPAACNPPATLTLNTENIGSSTAAALAKPLLIGLSLATLGYYGFDNDPATYLNLMYPGFFNVPINPPNPDPTVSLISILSSPLYTTSQIEELIASNGYSQTNPENGLLYGGGLSNPLRAQNNSITAFTNLNPNNPLLVQILNTGSTFKWKTHSPIDFIHLNNDSFVAIANYTAAYSYMSQPQVAPNLVSETTVQNASIYEADQCQDNNGQNAQIFCQKESSSSNIDIPLDHNAAAPFMYIGALCAFEREQGFTNICS